MVEVGVVDVGEQLFHPPGQGKDDGLGHVEAEVEAGVVGVGEQLFRLPRRAKLTASGEALVKTGMVGMGNSCSTYLSRQS
jgi:hypothetical protein